MKKTLLSLLITVAFAAPTFAADAEGLEAPTEKTNALTQSSTAYQYSTEHHATALLSRFAISSTGDDITLQQVKDAINQGGAFAGNSTFRLSPIHRSASNHRFELFQPFLKACLNKDPGYLIPPAFYTDASPFDSLLHNAAFNSDDRVAKFLIEAHDMKTDSQYVCLIKSIKYVFCEEVYPLFYAIRYNNNQLISLLSEGLTEDQIKHTKEQVIKLQTRLQHQL